MISQVEQSQFRQLPLENFEVKDKEVLAQEAEAEQGVQGFFRNWSAERILSVKNLLQIGFVIPEGQTLCVYYHADGGQCCDDGIETFTNPVAAAVFANAAINEKGHSCRDSVKIFLTKEPTVPEGVADLRANEPSLEVQVAILNEQLKNQPNLVVALWRQLTRRG